MEVPRLVGHGVAHGQRHRAVKANRIVDQGAFTEFQQRAIGEQRGVARAKDFQRLAFDGTGHLHLATRAFGLNHQRHRDHQWACTTAHGNRVGATRRTNHQDRNARQFAQIERQPAAGATQRDPHPGLWRHLQAGTRRGERRQIHRATALWNGDFDRLGHHRQHLAISPLGKHVLHRQIGVGCTIHTVLLERCQRDALRHIELDPRRIHDPQIALYHQALGVHHQAGLPQVNGRCAFSLDHDRVAHQAQRAQGLVPDYFFNPRHHLPMAQNHHVFGGRLVHRLEAQAQRIVAHLARATVHILELESAWQTIGGHGVAQVHGDLVGPF